MATYPQRMVVWSSRPSLRVFTDENSDTNSSVTALSRALGRAAHTHDYGVRLAKAQDCFRLCRYCYNWSDGVESVMWNVALLTCFCVLIAIHFPISFQCKRETLQTALKTHGALQERMLEPLRSTGVKGSST